MNYHGISYGAKGVFCFRFSCNRNKGCRVSVFASHLSAGNKLEIDSDNR